ncbi:pyridine nucleotide-disulfide oxidoreductase family protein [Deinococcus aerius]|uniref:Pyridine nucleotide-disulfide oxidoreductase family protein n=1 Tax=Deinococcus aerius TaxID=200253 RepID=A0A2I9CYG6_9DEIO|nr:pyridine nucleotide-disulfide oxidoreductase family protein [Deinococcus aerius]
MAGRPHLLLVGGGHANVALLRAAARWVRRGVRVTLLTPDRFLWYSGMAPEFVGGRYREEETRIDLLRLCLRGGVAVVPGRAARVDVTAREVVTAGGERLPYNLAVFDIGGLPADEEAAGNAVRVRPFPGLRRLVNWLDTAPGGRLTVVGGGAAGVELLLNITARGGRRPGFTFTLLEPGPRLLAAFAPGLGRHAGARLRARGVDVRLHTCVARALPGRVELEDGTSLPGDLTLWATGTRGQPLFRASGLPVGEGDFLRVTRTLQVPGYPRLSGAGDAVQVEGTHLDRSGVNAVKQGLHLRGSVDRLLRGLDQDRPPETVRLRRFRPYPASPYLLSTGEPEGWLALGPFLWGRGRVWLGLKHRVDRLWVGRYRGGAVCLAPRVPWPRD